MNLFGFGRKDSQPTTPQGDTPTAPDQPQSEQLYQAELTAHDMETLGIPVGESTTPQVDTAAVPGQPQSEPLHQVNLTARDLETIGVYPSKSTTPETPYEDLQGPKTKPFEPIIDATAVEGQSQWANPDSAVNVPHPDGQPPVPPTTPV